MVNYWWQNPFLKLSLRGKTIFKVVGEGCQACDRFDWAGKVIGFRKNKRLECDDIVIEIVKHNNSYTDSRDKKEKETFTYPLVNADIQNVDGVWILFT